MKERPILMNGEMVRAILAGRKTQTRRPLKVQPVSVEYWLHGEPSDAKSGLPTMRDETGKGWLTCGPFKCPFGDVGGHLWVRESFYEGGCAACEVDAATFSTSASTGHDCHSPRCCSYRADVAEEQISAVRWTPSIHMPRWASRLTLEVTDVRVERVTDISEADAMAEGVRPWSEEDAKRLGCPCGPDGPEEPGPHVAGCPWGLDDEMDPDEAPHRAAFAVLWESIYGNWKSRPWVWAVTWR